MTYIVVDYVPTGVAHLLLMAYLLFDVMVDVSFEPLIRLYSGSPSLIMFHMHLISGSMIHFSTFHIFFWYIISNRKETPVGTYFKARL